MIKYYGYARVSTKEQNEDRQLISLQEAGVKQDNIFVDKKTGWNFERPEYIKLINKLKKEDVLYVKSIDRLGRNYEEIQEQWKLITKVIEADIVVLDMPLLDTRRDKDLMGTFISDIVLALLSYVAENERVNIKQRQAEGIKAAKLRGVKFGRPVNQIPENFNEIIKKFDRGQISIDDALKLSAMSRATFYRRKREYLLLKNKR
ncbi:MAG: recombinase family protein [Lachnospiraceae bacterium]|nr:recombinase family protein [Lachnospiraceae bacterium]